MIAATGRIPPFDLTLVRCESAGVIHGYRYFICTQQRRRSVSPDKQVVEVVWVRCPLNRLVELGLFCENALIS